MPDTSLLLCYSMMVLAQSAGGSIIGLLWGEETKALALTGNDDVDPGANLEALCQSYESHHFSIPSNILHAAGMCLTFKALFNALTAPSARMRWHFLAYMPPLWYLYAWAGHFFVQRDIPAVFNYGTTLRGWASGEFCSVRALVGWGPSGFHTTPEASHVAATLLVMSLHMCTLPPFKSSRATRRLACAGSGGGGGGGGEYPGPSLKAKAA